MALKYTSVNLFPWLEVAKGSSRAFLGRLAIPSFGSGMRGETTNCCRGQMREHEDQIGAVVSPLALCITRYYESNDAL